LPFSPDTVASAAATGKAATTKTAKPHTIMRRGLCRSLVIITTTMAKSGGER
jgi:hypothetical protein